MRHCRLVASQAALLSARHQRFRCACVLGWLHHWSTGKAQAHDHVLHRQKAMHYCTDLNPKSEGDSKMLQCGKPTRHFRLVRGCAPLKEGTGDGHRHPIGRAQNDGFDHPATLEHRCHQRGHAVEMHIDCLTSKSPCRSETFPWQSQSTHFCRKPLSMRLGN